MTSQTRKTAIGSKTRIGELIEIASRLITLMEEETRLLRAMRPRDLDRLQEEKSRLSHAYEERVGALRADTAAIAVVVPALKEELRRTLTRFEKVAEENALALKAATEANHRLLRIIADAVAEQQADTPVYSSDGNIRRGNGKPKSVSISLNREL